MAQTEKQKLRRVQLNSFIRKRVETKLLPPGTTEKYIRSCEAFNKTQKNKVGIVFEKHHIVPKYEGGTDAPDNLVSLTPRQHVLTHLLRYLEIGQSGDFLAYVLRNATKDVDMSSHGKRMAEYYRQNQLFFFNSEFQSAQGKKGGSKGGSANTQLQWEARSKVGKTWGPVVGLSNQSNDLKTALSHIMVFRHEEENVEVLIPPCKSAVELFDYLHNEVASLGKEDLFSKERSQKVKGGGAMYNLIRGKKKKIYGWSIAKRIPPDTVADD